MWWERREGGHYIILSVVCAPWQTIPRLRISTKRRPKGVLQGSKPVCQCSAMACHALSQVGSKGGRREGISSGWAGATQVRGPEVPLAFVPL